MTHFFKSITHRKSPKTLEFKRVLGLVSALLLASCGPLISFGDDDPAGDIYTLRYEGAHSDQSPSGPIIYVDSPQMVDGLDGRSVSVRLGGNRRSTLAGASWSAHLSELVRDYVVQALEGATDANMISQGGLDIKAGCRLGIKVWAMEFVPGLTSDQDQVDVRLQFSLVRLSDSKLLSHPTFAQTVGVTTSNGGGVVAAFAVAMERASEAYGGWFSEASDACG
jgi:ABC-type uncharacterized transport system auxiliary subunit